MTMQLPGGAIVALVVFDHVPGAGEHGTLLSAFTLVGDIGKRPADYNGKITLAGGASAEFLIYVRDANGWAIAADAGNLGLVAGQALPTGKTYSFSMDNIGSFLEVALVQNTSVGVVVPSGATIQERRSF